MKPSLPPVNWGNWTYHGDVFALRHEPFAYDVDLDQCTDSATVLDSIAQVATKERIASADVGDLVRALNAIFYLQGNVCGMGKDHKIDPREVAKKNGYDIGKPPYTDRPLS
jgi:hypothetical protein